MRELFKFWISRFHLIDYFSKSNNNFQNKKIEKNKKNGKKEEKQISGGGLEKKDANMTMRSPKFFVSPPSLIKNTNHHKNNFKNNFKNQKQQQNVIFRFDFFGEQILEDVQWPSTSSSTTSSAKEDDENTNNKLNNENKIRRERRRERRPILYFLSLGSHIAKHVVMEQSITSSASWKKIISNRVIKPIREFINLKSKIKKEIFLNKKRKMKNGSTDSGDGIDSINNRLIIIFMSQSFDCNAMYSSELPSFKKMAKSCDKMENFLILMNQMIREEFVVSISKDEKNNRVSFSSSSDTITTNNIDDDVDVNKDDVTSKTTVNFLYIPPPSCSMETMKNFAVFGKSKSSKTVCTRDGIHLRSRFLRLKLDLLLNAVYVLLNN